MSSTDSSIPYLILDEFHCFNDDGLIRDLRAIEGVPNAVYQVRDGRVFVFDKLVHLVKAKQAGDRSLRASPVSSYAASLVEEARVSVHEAVVEWDVMPRSYELKADAVGNYFIHHTAFNTRLPGLFKSKVDADPMLEKLLVGAVVTGAGDFVYQGQAMSLCDPVDPSLLPACPDFGGGLVFDAQVAPYFLPLSRAQFQPGFAPVSEAGCIELMALYSDFKAREHFAQSVVKLACADLWAMVPAIEFAVLEPLGVDVAEDQADDLVQLRAAYPELGHLSDGVMVGAYGAFHRDSGWRGEWEVGREDDFLLFLLGRMQQPTLDRWSAVDLGKMAAYALLHKKMSLATALSFGMAVVEYGSALYAMSTRVSRAMNFISERKPGDELDGGEVVTMADMAEAARSVGFSPVLANQNFDAFAAGGPAGEVSKPTGSGV